MTPFLQTAGWALIHFVWQGAAIADTPRATAWQENTRARILAKLRLNWYHLPWPHFRSSSFLLSAVNCKAAGNSPPIP